jgi:pilus assembly protein TadC
MREALNVIRVLIAVDVGIVVFCYLQDNFIWLYNTQIAFFATSLIVIGSFVGYSGMVKRSIEQGNVGEDTLKKYEDKFDLYDEEDEIKEEELNKIKRKKLKWYEALLFSFKGGFNLIRILGYVLLVAGFLWLKNQGGFDFLSFIFGVSVVPAVSLVYLYFETRKLKKKN